MLTLTPSFRRDLRARAHSLHPVVAIGHAGLTPAVLKEIDVALKAHELVKVRVHSDDRDEREAFLGQVCEALAAGPVQHLGKLLIVWRPKPAEERERPRSRPSATRRRDERKPAPGRGGAEPQIGLRARKHRRGAARHEPMAAPLGKPGARVTRRRMTGGLAIPSAMREEPAPPARRPRGDARPPSGGKRPPSSGKRPPSGDKRPPSSGRRPSSGAKHGAPASVQRRRRTGGR